MKGKVLKLGLISGEDGNRYNFVPSDVANLGQKTLESLIGCEVDFQIQGDKASNILIIKDNKVASGNGIVALIITLFFGPIGAFFSWWLLAKWSFLKSVLYTIGYFVAFGMFSLVLFVMIDIFSIFAFISTSILIYIILYIIMCIQVYKAAKFKE